MPATPAAGATGSIQATQTFGAAAGNVVAGNMATQSTIVSNGPTYQSASALVGQSPTIMAGYDQNSSIGTQNGLGWNQVLATANLLVSAYNAINVMRVSQASQAARGMNFTSWASGLGAVPNNALCGAGFRGSGRQTTLHLHVQPVLPVAARWRLLGAPHHGFLGQRCRLSRTRAIAIGKGLDHETDDIGFVRLLCSLRRSRSAGASAGDRRRQSDAIAADGDKHQANSIDGSKHSLQCPKDAAGRHRRPFIAGARIAGANGARGGFSMGSAPSLAR